LNVSFECGELKTFLILQLATGPKGTDQLKTWLSTWCYQLKIALEFLIWFWRAAIAGASGKRVSDAMESLTTGVALERGRAYSFDFTNSTALCEHRTSYLAWR
jgi:hypothetical protein